MYNRLVAIILSLFVFSCVQEDNSLSPVNIPVFITMDVTNINSDGATFSIKIEELAVEQNVLSFGFVWSESNKPILNSSFSSSFTFTSKLKRGIFTKQITNDLILNRKYNVRAFVQMKDKVIYGNVVQFISQGSTAPIIFNFAPKEGFAGTEVVLEGKNFSRSISGNRVLFYFTTATVLFASDTLLRVKCPSMNTGDYTISVEASGKQFYTIDKFKVLK